MDNKKPKIIRGICEYCGIPAYKCAHYIGLVDASGIPLPGVDLNAKQKEEEQKNEIKISATEQRQGNPLKQKVADVVIAHWDRRDMLYQTLGSIPLTGINVIIIRGNTYSVSNNIGAKAAVTDNIIFCNDDMVVPKQTLLEMINSDADFAMARQFYPDGSPQHCGLKWVDQDFVVVTDPVEAQVPTAACFRVKREVFEKLGGFDEAFINGGEDHDLFFKALEAGHNFEFVDTPVIHYSSSSSGRFDFEADNLKLLKEKWPNDRLNKLFYEIEKQKKEGA